METIIYAGAYCLPDNDAAAHRINAVAKILNHIGYKVIITGYTYVDENELIKCNNKNRIYKAEKYPLSIIDSLKNEINVKLLSEAINGSINVKAVILYNYPTLSFNKIYKLCKLKNIKIIADCTEWYNFKTPFIFSLLRNMLVAKRMYNDNCRVDGIISISKYLANFYSQYNIKTYILPPVVDFNLKHFSEIPIKNNNNDINLVYPGNPLYKESIESMLIGIGNLNDVEKSRIKFHISGLTEDKLRRYLGNNVDILNKIKNNVIFHGYLTNDELFNLYRTVDFLYMARPNNRCTQANFPSKVPELMYYYIIPICNRVGDYYNYLQDEKNAILYNYDTPNECTEALRKTLALTKENIYNMKLEAHKCAIDNFDYLKWTNSFSYFIRNILQ